MSASKKPFVLGLTGGVGCGKTTAAAVLSGLGAFVVDADEISHNLTASPGAVLDAIRERFGDAVFGADGTLNRRALGETVFSSEEARRDLEGITHPAIQKEMLARMDAAAAQGAQVVVLDVPLLFETGLDALCDETWVMTLDEEQQALRIMTRDRISRDEAQKRINSQMPLKDKEARANKVISSAKPQADVKAELTRLYKELLRRLPE